MNRDMKNAAAQDQATITRFLYASAMLESWAASKIESTTPPTSVYLAARHDMADVATLFLAAAAHLNAATLSAGQPGYPTYREVVEAICIPFGSWLAFEEYHRQRPEEPTWRHWLMSEAAERLDYAQAQFAEQQYVITTALLMIRAERHAQAVERATQVLMRLDAPHDDTGLPPFHRYWILAGMVEGQRNDNRWLVQTAVETAGFSIYEAYNHLGALLGPVCSDAGIEWGFDVPDGRTYATGTIKCSARQAPPVGLSTTGRAHGHPGGILPAHRQ